MTQHFFLHFIKTVLGIEQAILIPVRVLFDLISYGQYKNQKHQLIDRLFDVTLSVIAEKLPLIRKETAERIFEQPYISPKRLIGQDIRSINTAKKYLNQMVELGIMSSTKIGKEIVYLNVDLYNILSES